MTTPKLCSATGLSSANGAASVPPEQCGKTGFGTEMAAQSEGRKVVRQKDARGYTRATAVLVALVKPHQNDRQD